MGLKRRFFLVTCVRWSALVLAPPAVWLAKRVLPDRYVEAIRSRVYPGPRHRLNESEIARPGHWGG